MLSLLVCVLPFLVDYMWPNKWPDFHWPSNLFPKLNDAKRCHTACIRELDNFYSELIFPFATIDDGWTNHDVITYPECGLSVVALGPSLSVFCFSLVSCKT